MPVQFALPFGASAWTEKGLMAGPAGWLAAPEAGLRDVTPASLWLRSDHAAPVTEPGDRGLLRAGRGLPSAFSAALGSQKLSPVLPSCLTRWPSS